MMKTMRSRRRIVVISAAILFANAASVARDAPAALVPSPNYSTLADLALAAPIVAVVDIRSATPLKGADAAGVEPGAARVYATGDVATLVAGQGGLPARVDWIADVPLVANRAPRLRKRRVLLLARAAPGAPPGTLQLVSKRGMIDWTPDVEARARAILTEKVAPNAPPAITGIGHAFHVAGSIPGEGETQVFLKTADGRPVSLSILRRPGEQPRWSVSLGEMVDDAAAAPKPETLLWYRLACGLPPALPDDATADQAPADAEQARADYAVVISELGPCRLAGSR